MEMTLNANFLAIENDDLELINGGHQNIEAAILILAGAGMMCVAAPLLCALAAGAASTFFLGWSVGAILTFVGVWWYPY